MAPVQSSRVEEIPLIEKHHASIYIKQINLKRAGSMKTQGESEKNIYTFRTSTRHHTRKIKLINHPVMHVVFFIFFPQ